MVRTETPKIVAHSAWLLGCCSIHRTAVYGAVRTVVWQGWAGDRSPYAY